MQCRQAHAAPFNHFAVFRRDQVEIDADLPAWESSPGNRRHFCPKCGSRIAETGEGDEIELYAGSFDDPDLFAPRYENWTIRRASWLRPLDVPQRRRDARHDDETD